MMSRGGPAGRERPGARTTPARALHQRQRGSSTAAAAAQGSPPTCVTTPVHCAPGTAGAARAYSTCWVTPNRSSSSLAASRRRPCTCERSAGGAFGGLPNWRCVHQQASLAASPPPPLQLLPARTHLLLQRPHAAHALPQESAGLLNVSHIVGVAAWMEQGAGQWRRRARRRGWSADGDGRRSAPLQAGEHLPHQRPQLEQLSLAG